MASNSNDVPDAQEGRQQGGQIGHDYFGALLSLARPTSDDTSSEAPACKPVILLLNIANTYSGHQSINTLYRLQPLDFGQEEHGGRHDVLECLRICSAAQSPAAGSGKNDLKAPAGEQSKPPSSSRDTIAPRQAQSETDASIVVSEAVPPSPPKILDSFQSFRYEGNNIWLDNEFSDNFDLTSMFNPGDMGSQTMMSGTMNSMLPPSSFASTSSSSSSSFGNINTSAVPGMSLPTVPAAIPTASVSTSQATAPLPGPNTNNRFPCTHPNYSADFSRLGDLRRHQRVHGAQGAPSYSCTVNNCVRKEALGFYRRDKLLDHMRKKHGMIV